MRGSPWKGHVGGGSKGLVGFTGRVDEGEATADGGTGTAGDEDGVSWLQER